MINLLKTLKKEVPIGIIVQDKMNDEESKSSVSDSYNKNSSDSNYGILNKSDSDSKKGDKENNQ